MTTYIGIDVGKKSLQVYLPINNKSFDIDNSQKGFNKLLSCLVRNYHDLSSLVIIFEPTGGYEHSLRKVLYMAAVASLRCNNKLKAFYNRLINNGKPAKVALTAVMRKLLAFMHAIVKKNSSWDSNLI